MAKSRAFIPNALRPWIEVRRRFHLAHAHIQMARALGMNPKKFAKLANHLQQPWKAPLPEFITRLYVKRFGRLMPDEVRSIEEIAALQRAKKRAKKQARKAPIGICWIWCRPHHRGSYFHDPEHRRGALQHNTKPRRRLRIAGNGASGPGVQSPY